MNRPVSITVISCVCIAVGTIALAAGLLSPGGADSPGTVTDVKPLRLGELGLVLGVRALLVVGGAFLLRDRNWARWLLVVWLGYHVVLGALHSLFGFTIHILLFAIVTYFLFRPLASAYFRCTATTDVQ